VSVSPMPIALFTADEECLGDDVTFTNQSTISSGSMTYSWDFDDNTASTDQNPAHGYAADGTYHVTLTATSSTGINCQAVYSMDITVLPVPVSTFTAGNMGNNLVNFVADDATGISYNWDFGDDSTSTQMNVQHQYGADGNYSVTLRVTNDKGCETESTVSITLNPTGIHKDVNTFNFGVYPNPFSTETRIRYDLKAAADVKIEVYDQLGRLIVTLTDGNQEAGSHVHVLNGGDIAPQTLIIRLTVGDDVYNQKIIRVR
jgi:PKD repeat protein